MTIDDFDQYLRELGMTVKVIRGEDGLSYSVARDYELPSGLLRGRSCDIAIQRDGSIPFVAPAAIHTRPHLVPMSMKEPLKTQASGIGPDWQYWSRRYDHRPKSKELWAHILTILCEDRWPTS